MYRPQFNRIHACMHEYESIVVDHMVHNYMYNYEHMHVCTPRIIIPIESCSGIHACMMKESATVVPQTAYGNYASMRMRKRGIRYSVFVCVCVCVCVCV